MSDSSSDSDLAQAKAAMRREMRARRRALSPAARAAAHQAGLDHLRAAVPMPADGVTAGFWSLDEEFDIRPLLRALAEAGRTVGLPTLAGRGQPLIFRHWTPDTPMSLDSFGVAVPPATAPAVTPTVLLVPLLAFDRRGYRLGYGGGYYDRTLAALRAAAPRPLAAGVAYAAQEVEAVPHAGFDQRLDMIVTEAGVLRPGDDPGG